MIFSIIKLIYGDDSKLKKKKQKEEKISMVELPT